MTSAPGTSNTQNLEIATPHTVTDAIANDSPAAKELNPVDTDRPHTTAVGQISRFLLTMAEQQRALEQAKHELTRFARLNGGGRAIAEIDPLRIHESRWVSTSPGEWGTRDFARLKENIMSTAGNVQPIKVRPAGGRSIPDCFAHEADTPTTFELVFGHRRHRACTEQGLAVLCVVEDVDDTQLVKEFVAENRGHPSSTPSDATC